MEKWGGRDGRREERKEGREARREGREEGRKRVNYCGWVVVARAAERAVLVGCGCGGVRGGSELEGRNATGTPNWTGLFTKGWTYKGGGHVVARRFHAEIQKA